MTEVKFKTFLAKFVSAVGHPIVLGALAAWHVNTNYLSPKISLNLSLQLLFGLILPLVVYIAWQIKQGNFKDFDVSNQSRRNRLYFVLIALLVIQVILLFIFDYLLLIKLGAIFVLSQIVVSFVVNRWIKVSLHTSFSFLVSTMANTISFDFAFALFLFAIAIGYSRVFLGRHSSLEVFLGSVLGIVFGFIFNLIYAL